MNCSACSLVLNSTRNWPALSSWMTVGSAHWLSLSRDFFRSLNVAVIGNLKVIVCDLLSTMLACSWHGKRRFSIRTTMR